MKKQHTKNNSKSRERKIRPEELGEKGEARFMELCADARLTANRSQRDVMGWDFLVEFPYVEPVHGEMLDLRPHPYEAKIQVKTAWAGKTHVKLRLSAAERLARSALPSFVMVFLINDDLSFSGMRIFHILDKNLEKVLKKLREISLEDSLLINRTNIEFALRDGVPVQITGEALRTKIADMIGGYMEYISMKRQQVQNIGFSDVRYEGKVTLNIGDNVEISEYLLGVRDAPFSEMSLNEVRFGISVPQFTTGNGIARITPHPVSNCIVTVFSKDQASTVRVPGILYVAPKFSGMKNTPFRVDTKLMKIVFTNNTFTISKLDNTLDLRGAASEIKQNILMWNYLTTGPTDLSLLVGGKKVVGAFIDLPEYEKAAWLPVIVHGLDAFERVLHNIGAEKPPISIRSIHQISTGVHLIDSLIRKVSDFKISNIRLEGSEEITFSHAKEALLIYQIFTDDFAIGLYATMDVDVKIENNKADIKVASVSLRDIRIMSSDSFVWDSFVEEARATVGIPLEIRIRTPTGEIL